MAEAGLEGFAKPKILLTGKPIYVDGQHHPGPIEGGGTVDEIVSDPGAQLRRRDRRRHPQLPALPGRRCPTAAAIQYIVNGGGGAFMHETHTIPNIDTSRPQA